MRRTRYLSWLLTSVLSLTELFLGGLVLAQSSELHHFICGRESSQNSASRMTSFTHIDADDVIFTDFLLFESSAVSTRDCAQMCGSHELCVTFTFWRMTSSGICRGHVGDLNVTLLYSVALGARSYMHSKALHCSQAGDGYTWQVGQCIRAYYAAKVSRDAAREVCLQNGGGHLIHTKTPVVANLVQCVKKTLGFTGDVWIGADDTAVEGEYRWSDGTLLDTYPTWGSGQPNDDANTKVEDCIVINSVNNMYDKTCDGDGGQLGYFVCQIYL